MSQDKECPELRRGEVYSPPPNVGGHDNFTQPTARQPLPPQPYTMQETPYLRNLRQCLQEATLRPFTFHDQQQHLLLTTCVEEMAIPCITIFMLLVNGLRLAYVSNWVTAGPWYEMLVLGPVRAVLPLLPLVFPTAWLCLTSYGNARLVALQHSSDSQEMIQYSECRAVVGILGEGGITVSQCRRGIYPTLHELNSPRVFL
ncbi:hypothetical protein J6590_040169 [Homalodisca vitripennis]|nr:hypothetical protein J6590_040169 [Homalodisca vitripennis]